jgi:hypothetical protein
LKLSHKIGPYLVENVAELIKALTNYKKVFRRENIQVIEDKNHW